MRLHMNQYTEYLGYGLANGGLHSSAQDMGVVKRHRWISLHMQIHVVSQAGFADLELFDRTDIRGAGRCCADPLSAR